MILLLLLSVCVCASVNAVEIERPHYDLDKAQEYFDNFVTTYNKHYDDRNDETQKRFAAFKENLKIINDLNAFNQSVYGISKFSDLTQKEFVEQTGCLAAGDSSRRGVCNRVTDADITGVKAPQSLDLRTSGYVTSVKNQGHCKSCWAFVSCGILEGAYRKKHDRLLNLAPKQLMDCCPSSGHCEQRGNTMVAAFQDLIGTPGVMLESDYPYKAEDSACKFQAAKAKVKVMSCSYFAFRNEDKLKEVLVQRGPIGLGIDSVPLQNYIGGITDTDTCPPGKADHAVLLVGYGTEKGKDYWLIKNTWGADWGEQGYFRLARGRNVCGLLNTYASTATVE